MSSIPERPFDENAEEGPRVITDRTPAVAETSREALRARLMNDPEVRERIERGLKELRSGELVGPGMTREELQDFLRGES